MAYLDEPWTVVQRQPPSARLSSEVLLSCAAVQRRATKQMQGSGVGSRETSTAVTLPILDLSNAHRGARGASSFSDRGPRRGAGFRQRGVGNFTIGLKDMLHKGDRSHTFEDPDEMPYDDGDMAEGRIYLAKLETFERKENVDAAPLLQPRSKKPSAIAPGAPFSDLERSKCIQASFRSESEEVEKALMLLQAKPGGSEESVEDLEPSPDAKALFEAFEHSQIHSLPLSDSALKWRNDAEVAREPQAASGRRGKVKEDSGIDFASDLGDHKPSPSRRTSFPPESLAGQAEIQGCIDTLNCIRKLCGLSSVRSNITRSRICNILSQSLLPRGKSTTSFAREHLMDFGAVVEVLLRDHSDRLSVMHGHGSLISAIWEAIGGVRTHSHQDNTITPGALSEHILAAAVAARVEKQRHCKDSALEISTHLGAGLGASVLPAALQPLALFWDLCPAPHSERASRNASKLTSVGGRGHAFGRLASKLGLVNEEVIAPPRNPEEEGAAFGAAASAPKAKTRRRGVRHRDASKGFSDSTVDAASIWGDRHGTLFFRRLLLNPSLSAFGVARRQDTSVIWTGTDDLIESRRGHPIPVGSRQDAVCYPPTGVVPASLLEGGRVLWSIIPDSTRFMPTETTCVQVYRCRIFRSPAACSAERLQRLAVRDFAVDCETNGEPFCVIFHPNLGEICEGDQIEVVLKNLCGEKTELTFFYEIHYFQRAALEDRFCQVAKQFRGLVGARELWDEPRAVCCSMAPVPPVSPPGGPSLWANKQKAIGFDVRSGKLVASKREADPPEIRTVSHHNLTFTANRCDQEIVVWSRETPCIQGSMFVVKSQVDPEEVPRAVQVLRLWDNYFILRLKFPLPKTKYEVRFFTDREGTGRLVRHPLTYTVTTELTLTLLPQLRSGLAGRYGFARVTTWAQRFSVRVFAPIMHRIPVGPCYFLVHIDKKVALEAAAFEAGKSSNPPPRRASHSKVKGAMREATTLFSTRLSVASGANENADVAELAATLRSSLEHRCQDTAESLHLDLSLQDGECVHFLREHTLFPGFYESYFNMREVDTGSMVTLLCRFPATNPVAYHPYVLAEWEVFRHENLPEGF